MQFDQATRRINSLNPRLAQVEANYRKQFGDLETPIGKIHQAQNYLSQQLAAIAAMRPGANSSR